MQNLDQDQIQEEFDNFFELQKSYQLKNILNCSSFKEFKKFEIISTYKNRQDHISNVILPNCKIEDWKKV